MIDLHVHTIFSDGAMTPATAARIACVAGYKAIALTDHADESNMEHVLEHIIPFVKAYGVYFGLEVFAGIELTHVPPPLIEGAVAKARALGAQIVLVHGESLGDSVERGTNHAAIMAGVDILAHPGLITDEDAQLAVEKGVFLEVTSGLMHCYGNGHVVAKAREFGAKLVLNNDAHKRADFASSEKRKNIARGAGMTVQEVEQAEANSRGIVSRLLDQYR